MRYLRSFLYLIRSIRREVNHLVSDFSKLNQAVTDLTAAVNAAVPVLQGGAADQQSIDNVTTQVNAATTAINAALVPPQQ